MLNPGLNVAREYLVDFSRRWKVTELALFGSQAPLAVESAIEIIGEAARLVSPALKAQHPEIPRHLKSRQLTSAVPDAAG